MAAKSAQRLARAVWRLGETQHGVVARWQLLELRATDAWIKHRVAQGRLHPVMRGVYAVGRPRLTRHGWWMAGVVRCGPESWLSHETAGLAWEVRPHCHAPIEVSVPLVASARAPNLRVHRRSRLSAEAVTTRHGIPITTPALTMVDLAPRLTIAELERMINKADERGHITPHELRAQLERMPSLPGRARVRNLLDRQTFVLTDSELERLFIPIALSAGLPMPVTQQRLNGFRVDFYWPGLGLVVETDGLRYHRTAAAQARDHRRDQAHMAAGLTPLRFTHAQVMFEAGSVCEVLAAVAGRLSHARAAA